MRCCCYPQVHFMLLLQFTSTSQEQRRIAKYATVFFLSCTIKELQYSSCKSAIPISLHVLLHFGQLSTTSSRVLDTDVWSWSRTSPVFLFSTRDLIDRVICKLSSTMFFVTVTMCRSTDFTFRVWHHVYDLLWSFHDNNRAVWTRSVTSVMVHVSYKMSVLHSSGITSSETSELWLLTTLTCVRSSVGSCDSVCIATVLLQLVATWWQWTRLLCTVGTVCWSHSWSCSVWVAWQICRWVTAWSKTQPFCAYTVHSAQCISVFRCVLPSQFFCQLLVEVQMFLDFIARPQCIFTRCMWLVWSLHHVCQKSSAHPTRIFTEKSDRHNVVHFTIPMRKYCFF